MIIEDHINFMGVNPLLGMADNGAVKFVDMSQAYSTRLRQKWKTPRRNSRWPSAAVVYLATTGPNYETPAEVKAFAWVGADAVGMSTVPEVIMARYHNIEVAGISCISNLAAGISSKKPSHEDVLAIANATQDKLGKWLAAFIETL